MVKTFALGYDKNLPPPKSRKMRSSCRAGWHLGSPRPRFSRSQPAPPSSPPCSPTTRSPPRSRRGWVTSGGSPRGPLSSWCTWWPCTPEHTSAYHQQVLLQAWCSRVRSAIVSSRHLTTSVAGRRLRVGSSGGGLRRSARIHNRAGLGRRREDGASHPGWILSHLWAILLPHTQIHTYTYIYKHTQKKYKGGPNIRVGGCLLSHLCALLLLE